MTPSQHLTAPHAHPQHGTRTHRFRWLSDSDILDDDVRRFLRTYTTPRRDSNGQLCWPLDEVSSDD